MTSARTSSLVVFPASVVELPGDVRTAGRIPDEPWRQASNGRGAELEKNRTLCRWIVWSNSNCGVSRHAIYGVLGSECSASTLGSLGCALGVIAIGGFCAFDSPGRSWIA